MASEEREEKTEGDGAGVVYIGHLPHGFYEEQMTGYFSQFGAVTKVRVARNRKVSFKLLRWLCVALLVRMWFNS